MRWNAAAWAMIAGLATFGRVAAAETGDGPPAPPLAGSVAEVDREKPPHALEEILAAWIKASRDFGPVEADFDRFTYDTAFETEKRATGTYTYERPFVFRVEVRPAELPAGASGGRKNAQGQPFLLVKDVAITWLADGKQFKLIEPNDDGEKEWVLGDLPADAADANYLDVPFLFKSKCRFNRAWFPLVVGVTEEDVSERFDWTLIRADADRILLHAVPRAEEDAAGHRKIEVLLDRRSYRTRALRLHDPTGTRETVYSFGDWRKPRPADSRIFP